MLEDCDDVLTGFHTCFAENAAWQRVAIILKDRHYPGSMEARSFVSALLANHSLLETLEILLRYIGIDPQVPILSHAVIDSPQRLDPATRAFLVGEQRRKDRYAARARTVEHKKDEAQRQKAQRLRAEEAKKVSKAKKEVKYKSLSEKVVVPGRKEKRKRSTLAELAVRYDSGDKSVKYCEKGCGKYYISHHKCNFDKP